jgi:hypothetical protein
MNEGMKEGRKEGVTIKKNDDVMMYKVGESNAREVREEDRHKNRTKNGKKIIFCHSEGPCANKWKKVHGVSVL